MKAVINSFILFLVLIHAGVAGDWPQWRGINRDGLVQSEKPLSQLPEKPKKIWQVSVGKGQGGLVIAGGRLVMCHEKIVKGKPMETVALIDSATGKIIRETPYSNSWQYTNVYGPGPRTAPMIDGDLIFCQSATGVLACISLKNGKLLWSREYSRDFGAKWFGGNAPGSSGTAASRHGNNGAPVADTKHIYAAAGGHEGASLVCLDKARGKLVWKAGSDYAAYSGLMLGELAGVQQVVMVTAANMKGYRSKDGKELWSVPVKTGAARNIVTPILHENTVTVASHTVGTFQVRISNSGNGQKAEEVWRNKDVRTNITTPVLWDGHIYGLGTSRGKNSEFVCLSHKTGKTMWSQRGYDDYASVIGMGDTLLIHGSRGALTLLKATPEAYTQIGRLDNASRLSWNFPVYSAGVLYLKDGIKDGGNNLTALQLR
jgi:outer membrane protein assembly factor BamB